jgi:hypothetical protein
MESNASSLTLVISEPFDKSLSMIRRMFWDAGITIVEEFDMSKEARPDRLAKIPR